jgi:hypothetical protein
MILHYIVDVDLFSKGLAVNDIVMYSTYTPTVAALLSISPFSDIIDDSIDRSKL